MTELELLSIFEYLSRITLVISKILCEIDIFVKDNPPIDKYLEVYISLALYIIKNQIKGYISNGRFQSLIK